MRLLTPSAIMIALIGQNKAKPHTRKINTLMAMVANKLQDKTDDSLEIISIKLKSYGCHCFPGNSKGPSIEGGIPVDGIDSACKQLAICRSCINSHLTKNFENPIDTDNTRYKFTFSKLRHSKRENDTTEQDIICNRQPNGRQNLEALCECDKKFAEDIAQVYNSWDLDYWHDRRSNSTVYREDICKTPGQINRGTSARGKAIKQAELKSEHKCCGSYPKPSLFYNTDREICCDGKVSSFGTC